MRSPTWSRMGELIYEWSIPLVTLTLPLEISTLLFPFWQLEKMKDGRPLSIVSFARLAMALVIVAGVIWGLKQRRLRLPRGSLALFLGLLLLDYVLSLVISPAPKRVIIEIVRLAFFIFFWAIAVQMLSDTRTILRATRMLIVSGFILGAIGIYQYLTKSVFWNYGLLELSTALRVNATFVDPNIYARFLVIAIVFGVLSGEERVIYRRLGYLAALVCLVALFFTGSRSSWLVLAAMVVGMCWWAGREWRLRILLPVGGIAALGAVLALTIPAVAARFSTFHLGVLILGSRIFLIRAGWQMFLDHPILGIGIGGYQAGLLTDYSNYVWDTYKTTLSHTSLINVMAELGIVGLVLTVGVFGSAFRTFRAVSDRLSQQHMLALASWLGILTVLISSQAEGRLYEDAYLWLFFALLVAIRQASWVLEKDSVSASAVAPIPRSEVAHEDRPSS